MTAAVSLVDRGGRVDCSYPCRQQTSEGGYYKSDVEGRRSELS
jgi:hypothetical protein